MHDSLPPFAALRAFEAVGRLGGVRRAAAALGVNHAIVSRHLRQLEEQLGRTLFDRAGGRLTETGRTYHSGIAAAIAGLRDATEQARAPRSSGLVIWCSPGLAAQWLTSRLADFMSSGSPVVVDLRAADRTANFADNDGDGDIRYLFDGDPPGERGVRHVELARPPTFPVASPQTAARIGPLRTARDLRTAPRIEEGGDAEWRRWFAAQNEPGPLAPAVGRYGHAHLTLAAARAGQGLALGNPYLVAGDLAAGSLVEIVTSERPLVPAALGAYVFRGPARAWSNPQIARFRAWLRQEFAEDRA